LLSPTSIATLGEWLAERGFAASAAKLIRRRLRHEKGSTRPRLLLALARARTAQGQPNSAYQSLLDALKQQPDRALEQEIQAELQRFAN
jgi:dienelactone hydrolase